MTFATITILILALTISVVATAVLCMAIERHSQRSLRREVSGLAPLNFP